jgi:hypothetical protein
MAEKSKPPALRVVGDSTSPVAGLRLNPFRNSKYSLNPLPKASS